MGTRRLSSEHGEFTLFFTLNSPFSNFYPCNFEAAALDKKITFWNCVEHFYMYNKAVSCGNRQAADAIFPLNDAKRIKRIGAELIEVDKAEWAEVSGDVMKTALKAKYSQNPDLRYLLFMTYGSRLVECSPQDRIWGIGLAIESDFATNPSRWRGENRLGKIMDEVRDEMWNEEQYIEERTKVEDGLGIPGFAAAYFEAKFPFTPTSFGVSTSEFTRDHSHSAKRHSQDYRNGSARQFYSDRRRSPASRRNHSRERRRDSDRDRGRRRSPFSPTTTRRRSRRSPTSRSPTKKRSRRERSSSSTFSSNSSRTPSPGEWRKNNRRQKSSSPVNGKNRNGEEKEEKLKTSADLIAEFLREHVQGVKTEVEEEKVEEKETNGEKGPILGPELPKLYKLEKSPEERSAEREQKQRRSRRDSGSSCEGRRRSRDRSREKKKREESRRKRSKSNERRHKREYKKSRSPARRHLSSSKKGGSRRDDSREAEKRRSTHSERPSRKEDERKSKENRESAERKPKPVPLKKEKTEEEKKKELMMQKLMSGLLNKNKTQYYYPQ